MEEIQQQKLAILIDADNAQPKIIDDLLAEIAKYGIASVKRIYGDWTSQHLKGWKNYLHEHALQPIQQFGYTTGKNSTDSAMIIDAMDLLYTKNFDGFCIVSSDSDFTRLASRLREAGQRVYGFGEKKTPKAFVSACDKFIYTEILRKGNDKKSLELDETLIDILYNAVNDAEDANGWVNLATLGIHINNQMSDFDPRNYGFRKLVDLVKSTNLFDVERRENDVGGVAVYMRDKNRRSGGFL